MGSNSDEGKEEGGGEGRGGVGTGKGTGKSMRTRLSKLPFSKLLFKSFSPIKESLQRFSSGLRWPFPVAL